MNIPKILIATPVRGALPDAAPVSIGWAESLRRLSRHTSIEISVVGFGCDLVRSRSRIVRQVLENGTFHAVLWWDDDVVPRDLGVIGNMISTGHDLVAAPYPQKLVNWEGAGMMAMGGQPAEWGAYKYPFHREPSRGDPVVHNGCIDVDHIGMGFMLTTTKLLTKMWDAYAPTLSFGDVTQGKRYHTVAMFTLMMPEQVTEPPYAQGPMLSEDFSFCRRVVQQGYAPQLYVGPGSPVDHVGQHVFRGHPEGLNGSGLTAVVPEPAGRIVIDGTLND